LLDMGRLQWKVGRAARKVDPGRPWEASRAAEFDAITLADWLEQNRFGEVATRLLAIAGRTVWGAEPREMSMLYVLQYVTSAGGLAALLDTEGGGQHWRFQGGAARVAQAMAAALPEGSLQFGHAVAGINSDPHGVTVTANSDSGEAEVRGGHVVVALPPALRRTLNFTPSIPDPAVAAGWKMANLTKCFAVYDEPFWRADGMTGEALTDSAPGGLTFDVSPPDAGCGVLVGFAGGDDARALEGMTEAEGREAVLKGFARLYGDKALKPEAWVTRAWKQEPWSGGGPVAFGPPGAIMATGDSLRHPLGRIHWAGTETSALRGGFIDGAIRAGERAAAEISCQ
jgi:monoamine oxidase